MFLDRDKTGGAQITHIGPTIPSHKSGIDLLSELSNVSITSLTGLRERREFVRNWSVLELIRAHTALRIQIVQAGALTSGDKILLQAMEREGIEGGGVHRNKIQVSDELLIPHGQGLATSSTDNKKLIGSTRIGVWSLI